MSSKTKTISFKISGMHCASCATNSTRQLKKAPGVQSVDVSYATEEAQVTYDTQVTKISDLKQAVESLGYQAHIEEGGDDQSNTDPHDHMHHQESDNLKLKLIISGILTLPLLLSMFPGMPMWLMDPRLQLILATPVQFWVGKQYYISAWKALKNGLTNMDTLIALGTSVAYFFSVAVILFRRELQSLGIDTHVYFETSATIITLILLGKFLEARAKGQTGDAIKKLLNLQAKEARLIKNGQEQMVSLDQVAVGDTLKVKPGEKIPTDGEILQGQAAIDESMVTGESVPVTKSKGNQVIGSTINQNGQLIIKTTQVGKNTFLAHIVQLVKQAQGSKAPIQKTVDKVSAVFVPTVIVLSLISFLIWFFFGPEPVFIHALLALIAVLIIACPCALGLATPVSIMVAVGRGAREGILIKDAENLETAGKINTVVFDKTGTLTEGKPQVQNLKFAKSVNNPKTLQSYIYSLEKESHHPLAEAIIKHLKSKTKHHDVKNFKDLSGKGISGSISSKHIYIGTKKLLRDKKIKLNSDLEQQAESLAQKAQTVSFVAVDGRHVAIIGIADTVKKSSKKVIHKLHHLNIKTVMLTGDNQQTAQAVAQELGIDHVIAEVLPSDKSEVIQGLKQNNLNKKFGDWNLDIGNSTPVVAMIGDGINDAPALATADIGIAMGLGTDVAIETAGITLLQSKIELVPKAVRLSRATLANIKQNLFWAFGYNTILIPVAMGILYPFFGIQINPIFASAAMALSSVSVVTNALRLKSIKL